MLAIKDYPIHYRGLVARGYQWKAGIAMVDLPSHYRYRDWIISMRLLAAKIRAEAARIRGEE